MKRLTCGALLLILVGFIGYYQPATATTTTLQQEEYATIRWGGRDNTHLIRPNGKVEFLGPLLTKVQRPDRTDERTFYMNVALNAVAKEGFTFAGMTHDEIVVRRPVR